VNLFSLAGKLAPSDHPPITLEQNLCTRTHDRFSKCDACFRACPVGAVQFGRIIGVNKEACIACGACVPICPVGAFSGEDTARELASCVARLPEARTVELVCDRHPAADNGPAEATTVICTGGCLAALGPAVYVWLLANGMQQVTVRLDACAECSIGKVQSQIRATLAHVRQLDGADRLVELEARGADWKSRAVLLAKNPPISRRDLFRVFAAEAPKLAAQALPFEASPATTGKTPPPERRRLLNALKRLDGATIAPGNGLGLVRLAVSEKCSACGVCARICPTGALRFHGQTSDFRLTFSSASCTDCGMCLDICKPEALQRAGPPVMAELEASEPVVLRAGALRECAKCHTKFAGDIGGNLCSICDFRQKNPFGSRMPTSMS
jgi:NAD-dependent dihydropyrimidine dehydrogenase PreA subunit